MNCSFLFKNIKKINSFYYLDRGDNFIWIKYKKGHKIMYMISFQLKCALNLHRICIKKILSCSKKGLFWFFGANVPHYIFIPNSTIRRRSFYIIFFNFNAKLAPNSMQSNVHKDANKVLALKCTNVKLS